MKTINIFISVIILSFTFVGCSDDFLDKKPIDKLDPADYMVSEANAVIALNGVYNCIRAMNAGREYYIDYPCMTDEMYNYSRYQHTQEFGQGSHSSNSYYALAKWRKNYQGIENANIVLTYLDSCYTAQSPVSEIKERIRGEAYFLRAFYYADLIDFYGDVPMYLEPNDLQSVRARDKKEIVLEQVLNDLDSAIVRLPVEYAAKDVGRATLGAALSLKGKTLLFNERYAEAATELKKVIDLKKSTGGDRYGIYPLYRELFLPQHENNEEIIFDIQYVPNRYAEGLTHDMYVYVVSWNSYCPLVNLAEAYYMTDGLPAEQSSMYDPAKPLLNRDPRLEYNIMIPRSKTGRKSSTGADAVFIPSVTGNLTSMKIRKFNDYTETVKNSSEHNIILIRFADVLLMYAEAAVMSGNYDDALVRDCIDRVRQRDAVKMPKVEDIEGVNLAPEKYMEIIMHERQVEFAFEGTRISDIRRWKIGDKVMTSAIGYDPNKGKLNPPVYEKVSVDTRVFNPNRDYLWPIPQSEIDTNPYINAQDQNPGY